MQLHRIRRVMRIWQIRLLGLKNQQLYLTHGLCSPRHNAVMLFLVIWCDVYVNGEKARGLCTRHLPWFPFLLSSCVVCVFAIKWCWPSFTWNSLDAFAHLWSFVNHMLLGLFLRVCLFLTFSAAVADCSGQSDPVIYLMHQQTVACCVTLEIIYAKIIILLAKTEQLIWIL